MCVWRVKHSVRSEFSAVGWGCSWSNSTSAWVMVDPPKVLEDLDGLDERSVPQQQRTGPRRQGIDPEAKHRSVLVDTEKGSKLKEGEL